MTGAASPSTRRRSAANPVSFDGAFGSARMGSVRSSSEEKPVDR